MAANVGSRKNKEQMLSIEFRSGGDVHVMSYENNGEMISVTSCANNLPKLLPAGILEALRDRLAGFLDLTATAPRLKSVNR